MAYTAPVIAASGVTFAQFQAGGPSGHLELLIAAQVATLAPTVAPTLGSSGTTSTLPAGTYWCVVTETNGLGETTAGPVSASQVVAATANLVVTFPTLKTGNTARNVYVGTAVGGPWTLAGTGITASTFTITAPLPSGSFAVNPPAVNTTALTSTNATTGIVGNQKLSGIRGCENGRLQTVWTNLRELVDAFNRGDPIPFSTAMSKLRDAHVVLAMLDKLCAEMGVLIDANPGSFHGVSTGTGAQKTVRTWP